MGSKPSKRATPARDSLSPAAPDAKLLRAPLPQRPPSPSKPSAKRVLFAPEPTHQEKQEKEDKSRENDDNKSAPTAPGLSLAHICTASSTRRAEQLKQLEASDAAAEGGDGLSRFAKYRNFFKNHDTDLARAITRLVTRASKRELRAWVAENVGALEAPDAYGKRELVELAMVSAAIAIHGEPMLARLDAKGELANLPNTALDTHALRAASKQQACRAQSKAARKEEKQAAHYVGLEVMVTLNARLPVGARVGDELREILNDASNLRLVLATSNQSLHKTADKLLMVDYAQLEQDERDRLRMEKEEKEDGLEQTRRKDRRKKTPRNRPTAQEYARLVQVAKHAQSDAFQQAMRAANGVRLYESLRDQFLRLDVGDRDAIWDVDKDSIVSSKGYATKVVLHSEETGKSSNASRRTPPSRSPSPVVDALRTAKQSSTAVPVRSIAMKARAAKTASVKLQQPSNKPKQTRNPVDKLVKKTKEPKPAKEEPLKLAKENRARQNLAAATPSTRRVTRSRGAAKHVALPETFSDSSEFEDDSEYEDGSDE